MGFGEQQGMEAFGLALSQPINAYPNAGVTPYRAMSGLVFAPLSRAEIHPAFAWFSRGRKGGKYPRPECVADQDVRTLGPIRCEGSSALWGWALTPFLDVSLPNCSYTHLAAILWGYITGDIKTSLPSASLR